MALLSKKERGLLLDPLADSNPITVQVLGVCSALAVTAQLKPSIVMAVSVVAVMGIGSVIISLLRNLIPPKIKIIAELTIAAALVVLVDQILKAYSYELSKQLSVFIGLILTNCILMGRFEAFALANKPWPSFLDAVGNASGYGIILIIVGFFRELFGSGSVMGYRILGDPIEKTGLYALGYEDNGFMLLSPMALILMGVLIWVQRSKDKRLIEEN